MPKIWSSTRLGNCHTGAATCVSRFRQSLRQVSHKKSGEALHFLQGEELVEGLRERCEVILSEGELLSTRYAS